MISVQTIQTLAMGGVTGIVLGAGSIFAYLTKKGVNPEAVLNTAEEAIEATEPMIAVAKKIAPTNPVVNIADYIEKWAVTGVKNAQQLYHISKLTNNDDRNATAKETIYAALKEINVTPNENQEILINAAIEAAVGDLGHKDKTEAEKEAEKQSLMIQNQQLQNTIVQQQQRITQIQSAVQSA